MEISDRPHLLVVGGSGFIGRALVTAANAKGWRVSSLSREPIAKEKRLLNVSYLFSDIREASSLKETLSSFHFDYVVNLSGYVNHQAFSKGGEEVFDAHFLGLKNLIKSLSRDKLKSLVQIGSSDEYGNQPSPQEESMRESPISPYSMAKVASSQFLQMLYKTENFPATVLRLFLVYGPGQNKERFIPQIIQGCLSNQPFPTSKGEQLRDFCFIDDVVNAIFKTLETKEALGEVINIASGTPVSIFEMIESIKQTIGQGKPQYGDYPYRVGENMSLYADVKKAKDILGWQASTELSQGLAETISSYK
jgi:nucleoside-diphosphate-sugar epimerase